jgi:hypothetical protein
MTIMPKFSGGHSGFPGLNDGQERGISDLTVKKDPRTPIPLVKRSE